MKKYAKAAVAIAGAALIAAASALPEYNNEIQILIALVTAVGVYLAKNEEPSL